MNRIIIIIVGIIILATGAVFVSLDKKTVSVAPQIENDIVIEEEKFDKSPDFKLLNFEGKEFSLNSFEGKAKVINSWAVWCPFCKKELSDFAELQEEFGDGLAVVAINRKESLKKQKEFTDAENITEKMIFLLDPKDSFYLSIGGFSMPETIFLDKDNNIIFHKRGPMELSEMREKVNEIISR